VRLVLPQRDKHASEMSGKKNIDVSIATTSSQSSRSINRLSRMHFKLREHDFVTPKFPTTGLSTMILVASINRVCVPAVCARGA
jgi:hypothetical protein